MWIFCCGMRRSGSTLQFQIVARLVEESGLGKRVEWVKPNCFPKLRAKYADYNGWKVFKTHFCTDEILSEFRRKNAIGIYVFRDIRDVFVSTMKKGGKTAEQLLNNGFIEECLQNHQKWTNLQQVMVSRYENMIIDLPGEVKRTATHLGISLDRKKYELIASDYAIQKQRERIKEFKKKPSHQLQHEEKLQFDPVSLLHTNHISLGEIGRWKKELSLKEIAIIEKRAQNWLVTNGYELATPKLNLFQRILLRFFTR